MIVISNSRHLNKLYWKAKKRNIFYLCLSLILMPTCYGKVTPQNYNFSLEKIQLFVPGSQLSEIDKKYPKKEQLTKSGDYLIYKYYIEHIRYKFPLLIQVKQGIVTDVLMKLPSYFLHDIFHQSLINRIGKQDKYQRVEEQAIYIWNNKNNFKHSYFASCTITCFPVYYAIENAQTNANGDYKSILQKLLNQELNIKDN